MLQAGVMDSAKGWQPTEQGTPQGAVISPAALKATEFKASGGEEAKIDACLYNHPLEVRHYEIEKYHEISHLDTSWTLFGT
jgi:hypothetical protein